MYNRPCSGEAIECVIPSATSKPTFRKPFLCLLQQSDCFFAASTIEAAESKFDMLQNPHPKGANVKIIPTRHDWFQRSSPRILIICAVTFRNKRFPLLPPSRGMSDECIFVFCVFVRFRPLYAVSATYFIPSTEAQ